MRPVHHLIAATLLLAACNPPLRGGLYLLTTTDVRNDSCELWAAAWDYEDDGSLWWEDRETLVVETTSGQWVWDYDGDVLTSSEETSESWSPDCEAVFVEDSVGEIEDPNRWTYTQTIILDLVGACTTWDISVMPCTVDIDSEANRIGD